MLKFYDKKESVPKGVRIVESNDAYFNLYTLLENDPFTRRVLKEIDGAEYYSEKVFTATRFKEAGNVYREYLSTGAKTLLNVYKNPEVCFNLAECGYNALELLVLIENGMVYCDRYVIFSITHENRFKNFIEYNNKHYNDLNDFIEDYRENYEDEHKDRTFFMQF